MTIVGGIPGSNSQLDGSSALPVPWGIDRGLPHQDTLPGVFPEPVKTSCPCDGGVHDVSYGTRQEGECQLHIVHTRIPLVAGRSGKVEPFTQQELLTKAGREIADYLAGLALVSWVTMTRTSFVVAVPPSFGLKESVAHISGALRAVCPHQGPFPDPPETSSTGFYL